MLGLNGIVTADINFFRSSAMTSSWSATLTGTGLAGPWRPCLRSERTWRERQCLGSTFSPETSRIPVLVKLNNIREELNNFDQRLSKDIQPSKENMQSFKISKLDSKSEIFFALNIYLVGKKLKHLKFVA